MPVTVLAREIDRALAFESPSARDLVAEVGREADDRDPGFIATASEFAILLESGLHGGEIPGANGRDERRDVAHSTSPASGPRAVKRRCSGSHARTRRRIAKPSLVRVMP